MTSLPFASFANNPVSAYWYSVAVRAFWDSFKVFGTGPKKIGLTLLEALVLAFIVFFVRGWKQFKEHLIVKIAITFGSAILTWLLVFVVVLIRLPAKMLAEADANITKVIQEKQQFSEANGRLAEENERLRKPTSKAEESEKQKRSTIRTELGKLLDRNIKIREDCMNDEHPAGFSCMSEYLQWRDQTRNYISKNMEPSFLARFKATIGTHAEYKTSSGSFLRGEESDALNLLTFSGMTLDEFIREIPN